MKKTPLTEALPKAFFENLYSHFFKSRHSYRYGKYMRGGAKVAVGRIGRRDTQISVLGVKTVGEGRACG